MQPSLICERCRRSRAATNAAAKRTQSARTELRLVLKTSASYPDHFETQVEVSATPATITLSGKVLGCSLKVEEIVTHYDVSHAKAWKTVGSPRLLVIGPYGMGLSLVTRQGGSVLRVFIDYAPPDAGVSRLLGRVFGKAYANWCTSRMASDAVTCFNSRPSTS